MSNLKTIHMETKDIFGLVIGFVAVAGGLGIGLAAVVNSIKEEGRQKLHAAETRHKERLALIEKGMDPLLADKKPVKRFKEGALLWGLLLLGVGTGLLLSPLATDITGIRGEKVSAAMMFFFGGLDLLVYYVVRTIWPPKKAA